MKPILMLFPALVMTIAIGLATGGTATAQCLSYGWDGTEPHEFTHCVDPDDNGVCQGVAAPVNGVFPNGLYPACTCPDGSVQTGHGHWEYTSLQTEAETGDTEEKDYLNNQDANGDTAGQTTRFLSHEPGRFERALVPNENPSGHYWQVDEWIGPGTDASGKLPLLTWTERFFACSHGDLCGSIGSSKAYGGYWTNQPDSFFHSGFCGGDGREADPTPARNAICGGGFTSCQ